MRDFLLESLLVVHIGSLKVIQLACRRQVLGTNPSQKMRRIFILFLCWFPACRQARNPVLGTNKKSCTKCGIFCLAACKACFAKQTNEKSRGERSEPGLFVGKPPRRTYCITESNTTRLPMAGSMHLAIIVERKPAFSKRLLAVQRSLSFC